MAILVPDKKLDRFVSTEIIHDILNDEGIYPGLIKLPKYDDSLFSTRLFTFQLGQLLQLPQQQASDRPTGTSTVDDGSAASTSPVERRPASATASSSAPASRQRSADLVAGHSIGLEFGRHRRHSRDAGQAPHGADPSAAGAAVGPDDHADHQGDDCEIPRGRGDEEQGDDGQAVHAHEGSFMSSQPLPQIHSDGHPEPARPRACRRSHVHAGADGHVPEAISCSYPHPDPNPGSGLHSDDPEHDEGRHEADQENQVS